MFTIYPNGGLCNRLFALNSAIRLSEAIGHPLRAVWISRGDFGCRFDDLFDAPVEVGKWHYFSHLGEDLSSRIEELIGRYLRWPPLRPKMFPTEVGHLADAGFDFESLGRQRRIDICATGLFYKGGGGFYPFKPRAHLQSQVDAVAAKFGPKTIGLHLRRTDHVQAIENSPTERFELEITRVLETEPDTTFFVASDAREEIERLSKRFPGKVIANPPATLDRDSLAGMEGAVIDLFSLARTQRILGSSGSTFSEAAGLLGGIDVNYMKAARSGEAVPTNALAAMDI